MATYCSKLPSDGASTNCNYRVYEPRSMAYLCVMNGECDLQTDDITESNPLAKSDYVPSNPDVKMAKECLNQLKYYEQDHDLADYNEEFESLTTRQILSEYFETNPLRASAAITLLTISISLVICVILLIVNFCLTIIS